MPQAHTNRSSDDFVEDLHSQDQPNVFEEVVRSSELSQHKDRVPQSDSDEEAFEAQDNRSCISSHDGSSEAGTEMSEGDTNVPHTSTPTSSGQEDGTNTNEPAELEEFPANIPLLESRRNIWENKHLLSAIIAVVGSVRFTVKQFEYTRNILSDLLPDETEIWPSYSTIQRCFKNILSSSMPESTTVRLPKKRQVTNCENGFESDGQDLNENDETLPVKIFYPSAWAKLDVSTTRMYEDRAIPTAPTSSCLENSLLVSNRSTLCEADQHLLVQHNEENVKCSPGDIVSISAQNTPPTCDTPFIIHQSENGFYFDATIVATWGAGTSSSPPSSWKHCINHVEMTTREKDILQHISSSTFGLTDSGQPRNVVLPGDLCTLLRADHECRPNEYVPVILHRFWRCEPGTPSIIMIWVLLTSQDDEPSQIHPKVHVSEIHIVSNLRLRSHASNQHPTDSQDWKRTLKDGTPFVVYRILIYSDDFQQSSYSGSSGSAGGFYFMLLAIPPEERTKTSSVRLISLTPPGLSSNEVLKHIVKDLVENSISGIEGVTIDGKKVRIFLDVVGFVGDYPASAGVIDVLGHVGRSPCTLCTFRRPHAKDVDGTRYGYTTDIHANNSTFLRKAERHKCLRNSDISKTDANILGMVPNNRAKSSPLLYLHEELLKKFDHGSRPPLTSAGTYVVPARFDPYRFNVVAPDHLLTGLSKNILNAVFSALPSAEMRMHFDIFICNALRDNGLLPQREVYNWQKNAMHSMTLSEIFCVLLVAVPTLKILASKLPRDDSTHEFVQLLNQLHRLIRLTYWWPRIELDGLRAENFVHHNTNRYFSELKRLSKEYVRSVDRLCAARSEFKSSLDKPNLHRLVELYEHSLPSFGHVREFMELIFESVHQPLKRSISNSNNHNAHIFAMEQCVGNDWQGRIASLSREIMHDLESRRLQGKRALRRLLIGAEADELKELEHQTFISETDSVLEKLFTKSVKKHFDGNNLTANFNRKTRSVWKATGKLNIELLSRICGMSHEKMGTIISSANRWIDTLYPPTLIGGSEAVPGMKLYKKCKRMKLDENGRQVGGVSGFDILTANCVLQIQLARHRKNSKVIMYEHCENATSVFFIFVAALHRKGDHTWALCLRSSIRGDILQAVDGFNESSFQVLCITDEVRRIAVYHVCQDAVAELRCKIDTRRKSINHTVSPLEGAKLFFQRRIDGYPPRVA